MRTRGTIRDQAAKTAYKTSRVIGLEDMVGGLSYRVYPDRRWLNPFADGTPANPGGAKNTSWMNIAGAYPYLDIDARIWMFTDLSFPKITSGRIDDAVRPRWEWRQ